jgi:hypothetical protein
LTVFDKALIDLPLWDIKGKKERGERRKKERKNERINK